MSKKHRTRKKYKANRESRRLAKARGLVIPFEDNKGNIMQLDGKLTIAELLQMGMNEIRLMPKGSPLPDNWWRDAGLTNHH